jgi:cytochrome P450
MQLLIDAQDDDFDRSNDNKEYSLNVRLEKKLTFEEVNGNLLAFLLAGYETTSTTLSYCFWVLATHPEELKKLQQEMDTSFELKSSVNKLNVFLKLSRLICFFKNRKGKSN